jgi:hypothetical protein
MGGCRLDAARIARRADGKPLLGLLVTRVALGARASFVRARHSKGSGRRRALDVDDLRDHHGRLSDQLFMVPAECS